MKLLLPILLLILPALGIAQTDSSHAIVQGLYRAADTRVNDLVHTKLAVNFDYGQECMYGKAWITLTPHFYATDSLILDAKQMDVAQVGLVSNGVIQPLKYIYNGWMLAIPLGRSYKAGEKYTVYIEYNSSPKKAKTAAGDNTGLHFINPHGTVKNMPVQVWTDDETENTSFWCPTIDKPNQKSTLEIAMTVPGKFVSLSNGVLVNSKANDDSTRTDNWKMDMPISPYVFFMAVGDFAIVKDHYKNIPVDYYVEKEYAPVAKKIFGLTPAMMDFFSSITGVPYPWPKYAQVVLRNFTSTAMENTSATAHAEGAQQDARELAEQNRWEDNIAHELFHQWFGDYVTCESWSNLVLNEGFANYGQYLWRQYYYGNDAADEANYNNIRAYLGNSDNEKKDVVRFNYDDAEDLFDDISYQKGGSILHMLKHCIGDSAFFKGLNVYLVKNKFKPVEVHDLRLAFEEVTGYDLNWFFNEWFYGSGHPKADISYSYDETDKKVTVIVEQKQEGKVFTCPVNIDVYDNNQKTTYPVWLRSAKDTFVFAYLTKPELVNVDADKYMLWEKNDHKTLENYIYQYRYAGNYIDRIEAVTYCLTQLQNPQAMGLVQLAMHDKYWGIRNFTLLQISRQWARKTDTARQAFEGALLTLCKEEKNAIVRAKALDMLSEYKNPAYKNVFMAAINDSAYSVVAAALTGLYKIDSAAAVAPARKQMGGALKRSFGVAVLTIIMNEGLEDDFDFITDAYKRMPYTSFKLSLTAPFAHYIDQLKDTGKIKQCIDLIIAFRNPGPDVFKRVINDELGKLAAKKEAEGLIEQAAYIRGRLPK